jgi:hypothetical protein
MAGVRNRLALPVAIGCGGSVVRPLLTSVFVQGTCTPQVHAHIERTGQPKRRIGRFLKSMFFGRRWVIGGVRFRTDDLTEPQWHGEGKEQVEVADS